MEHLMLTEHLSAARMARHWVCDHCPEEHLPQARRWIAELLTSELVANALEHGRGPVTLSMTHDDEGILVGISDGETTIPAMGTFQTEAGSGRGIALVDALSTTWGFYPSRAQPTDVGDTPADVGWPEPTDELAVSSTGADVSGKTVWFHLAAN